MKLEFFTIPVLDPRPGWEALNKFLAQRNVLAVDRHLVTEHGAATWAICVTYADAARAEETTTTTTSRSPKVDYREVLSESDFAVFARLRELRKRKAAEAGVPLYSVFTNEQLAQMVTDRMTSKAALGRISGVSERRVDKYGAAFLGLLRELLLPTVVS
ncbi:MAG: HRDC domain-containing protein [Deltaproteobacteria bacterium]|jgi:superfamily II DNA helicase RecQ